MSDTPFYKTSKFWTRFIILGLFFLFLGLFSYDLIPFAQGWWNLALILLLYKPPPLDLSLLPPMLKIASNVTVYIFMFVLSTFVVAQFVLPVETWKDRWTVFWRLFTYGIKWLRGPAVFVKNGQLVSSVGEEDNTNPGVIVVDLRSAVVVEQAYPHLGEADDFLDQPVLREDFSGDESSGFLRTLRVFRREKEYPIARVLGPGIHFTQTGEKIRTAVDLRKQSRSVSSKTVTVEGKNRLEPGVRAFTRDGIEVSTNCSVVFSLSDPPDIIKVAYWGGNDAKHLYELDFEKDGNTIKKIHPLDILDAMEIHQAVLSGYISTYSNELLTSEAPGLYPLDINRVFDAAYGQPGISSKNKPQWHELPLGIASDIFRNLIEKYDFDYLYSVEDSSCLTWMDELRPEFFRHVKYEGVLSYQLVRPAGLSGLEDAYWNIPLDGQFLNLKLGERFNLDVLEFSSSYPLTGLKSLRDRGIKIISAGFSELKMPANIRDNLIEGWKARWERDIQVVLARQERETMQIISSARNRAQRDNAYFLSNLFKEEKYSTEALALLIFQSLELAATDINGQKELPPKEVFSMLQNLHNWLLSERQKMDDRKKNQKRGDDSNGKGGGTQPA